MGAMEPIAMAATGVAGSVAGGKTAQAFGAGENNQPDVGAQITKMVNQMNNLIVQGQQGAFKNLDDWYMKAADSQNTAQGQAAQALNQATQGAIQGGSQAAQQGANIANSILKPYTQMGYTAGNSLYDSLGLSRPTAGFEAAANKAEQRAALAPLMQQLAQQAAAYGVDANGTPIAPDQIMDYNSKYVPQSAIDQYIRDNTKATSLGSGRQVIPKEGQLEYYRGQSNGLNSYRVPYFENAVSYTGMRDPTNPNVANGWNIFNSEGGLNFLLQNQGLRGMVADSMKNQYGQLIDDPTKTPLYQQLMNTRQQLGSVLGGFK